MNKVLRIVERVKQERFSVFRNFFNEPEVSIYSPKAKFFSELLEYVYATSDNRVYIIFLIYDIFLFQTEKLLFGANNSKFITFPSHFLKLKVLSGCWTSSTCMVYAESFEELLNFCVCLEGKGIKIITFCWFGRFLELTYVLEHFAYNREIVQVAFDNHEFIEKKVIHDIVEVLVPNGKIIQLIFILLLFNSLSHEN